MISCIGIILNHPNPEDCSLILMPEVRKMARIPEKKRVSSLSPRSEKGGVRAPWHRPHQFSEFLSNDLRFPRKTELLARNPEVVTGNGLPGIAPFRTIPKSCVWRGDSCDLHRFAHEITHVKPDPGIGKLMVLLRKYNETSGLTHLKVSRTQEYHTTPLPVQFRSPVNHRERGVYSLF